MERDRLMRKAQIAPEYHPPQHQGLVDRLESNAKVLQKLRLAAWMLTAGLYTIGRGWKPASLPSLAEFRS